MAVDMAMLQKLIIAPRFSIRNNKKRKCQAEKDGFVYL